MYYDMDNLNVIIQKKMPSDTLIAIKTANFDDWYYIIQQLNSPPNEKHPSAGIPEPSISELKSYWQEYVATGKHKIYTLYHQNENRLLGSVSLFDSEDSHKISFAIIPASNRNCGYMSHALSLLLPYFKNDLQINELQAMVPVNNEIATHLLHKFNFREISIVSTDTDKWRLLEYK